MIREVWPCLMNGESDNANQCDPCSFPAAGPTTTIKYIPLVYFFNPIVTLLRPTVTKLPLNYIINPNIFLVRTFTKCIPHLQQGWEAGYVDKRRCSYRCWGDLLLMTLGNRPVTQLLRHFFLLPWNSKITRLRIKHEGETQLTIFSPGTDSENHTYLKHVMNSL